MQSINTVPRSALVVRVLVACIGSVVELPEEPDPGFSGSSYRVKIASGHHGASSGRVERAEISHSSRVTLGWRAVLDPPRAPRDWRA